MYIAKLLWTPKHDPSKKIEIDWAEALGGGRFLFLSNNQPKDGVRGGGDIKDVMQPRRNVSGGGRFGIVWGGESIEEKYENLIPGMSGVVRFERR